MMRDRVRDLRQFARWKVLIRLTPCATARGWKRCSKRFASASLERRRALRSSGVVSRRTIFWDVDTQVDFMLPSGSLHVPGAEVLLPNLGQLTAAARGLGLTIVHSADDHEDKAAGKDGMLL